MTSFLSQSPVLLVLLGTIILLPVAHLKLTVAGLPLYFSEAGVLLALSFFVFRFFSRDRREADGDEIPDSIAVGGALLFFSGALISFFQNPFSLTGLGMLKSWFVIPLLFGFLLWRETNTLEKRRMVLGVWLFVLLGIALRALWFFAEGSLTYDGRLASDYASPNFLAFMVAPAPLLLCYFFGAFSQKEVLSWRGGIFFFLASALSLGVLFLTHSYGAWLGILGGLTLFFLGQKRKGIFLGKQWIVLLFLLVTCLGFLVLEQGSKKWQDLFSWEERSSGASRMMIWEAALKIGIDHPVEGIGVGRFQEVYLAYQRFFPPYLEWAVPEPHNLFLAVFLATGLLGFLGFLLLLLRLTLLLFRRCQGGAEERVWALLMLSLLMLFCLYGLADTPYFKNDLALVFFLVVALALPHEKIKTSPGEEAGLKR